MTISLFNMLAYNLAILVWLGYLLAKCPARDVSAKLLVTQRWDQSLTDLQHPLPGDSLIPMFEGMVDRAFSRTTQYPSALEAAPDAEKLVSQKALGSLDDELSAAASASSSRK